MAMTANDKKQQIDTRMYNIERGDDLKIGVHTEAEMARVAAVVTSAAHEEQQFTKLDADDFRCRPWDVSYAFSLAAKEILGQPLKGKAVPAGPFGGTILPGMHNFSVQMLQYELPTGEIVNEYELEEMTIRQIVSLAELVGSWIPTHYSADDKEQITDSMIKVLEIVGVDEREIRVPFGNVTLSYMGTDIGSAVIGGFEHPELGMLGRLSLEVQNKNIRIAQALINRTKDILARKSIYRGRCIDSADDRPSFWNPFETDPNSVVLSQENLKAIQTNIMYPIKWRERAAKRDKRLLKRTFVWSGEYGTGKSMTMILMAQWAIKNGWTVVRHKAGSDDLSKTMQLARIMQPCLVLVEDAEVFAASSDKETVSKLLDDFDGMLAKSGQIITILTTNHESEITKGMTRPGRIDGLMRFGTLDGPAIQQLFINMLGTHTIEKPIPSGLFDIVEKSKDFTPLPIDWDAVRESVVGYTGAFHAEVVKRAALAMLDREKPIVQTDDLVIAADSLRDQFEVYCSAGEPEHKDSLEEAMMDAFKKAFEPAFEEGIVRVQMDTEEGTFEVLSK
jgi:transitional endoplasmic reticulum ATPase